MQQTCPTCHTPAAGTDTRCARCQAPLGPPGHTVHLRPALLVPDAPPPRRAAWLPWAIAGGVLLLLVLFLAAAIGIPLFLGARDRARAAVPLREPGAVGALPRVRDEYVQGKEREFIDNFRRGGYDNAVVATYGTERDGLLVLAVRTASLRARADFVPAARRDLEAQVRPRARPSSSGGVSWR
jgi:hypothetical protein